MYKLILNVQGAYSDSNTSLVLSYAGMTSERGFSVNRTDRKRCV